MKQMEMVRAAWRAATCGLICLLMAMGLWTSDVSAQGVTTTTVQGTVYLANGRAGSGTLTVRWPAFTTATGQAVAADSLSVKIPATGFVSVNLAPNQGSLPAGQYYTAVYYMSDGSTSTEYWVIPAAATVTLAQVRAMVMPSAQAVQAASKAYVDQAVSQLAQSMLTTAGGTLTGPLILSGDPSVPLQAADKHYVDVQVAKSVPLAGGNMSGALNTPTVNGVQSPAVGSAQTTLQAAVTAAGTGGAVLIPPTYTGADTFTNPNGVRVSDLRTSGSQQTERSVKEFGAVCDGITDDTNGLQSALNYANAHGVALTIPEGTCKTRTLNWRGESIGGMGKQVSALKGFPGQDVLASAPDSMSILSNTRLHDLTIYVDQSVDASCAPAKGRAVAGSCQISRLLEPNSVFSPGGNGLSGTTGSGAGWAVGNCAIAMQAATGLGGNGLKVAEVANLEIATTGVDTMAAQYLGARSTHTCGMYLAQWPQWSEFRNIDIRGVNTGIAIPALPGTTPLGLNADSNRWQNITVQAVHGFTAGAGSNNVMDNFVALAGNAAAMAEPPTGLVLDFTGSQQGWTVRNAVVLPSWTALQPVLTVTSAGGAVTAVSVGAEHGAGWDPYGVSVPVAFSGSCTAQATAAVNSDGSIGAVTLTQGGVGCSSTTTASVNAAGTWNTAAPVNLISGQNQSFFAGNLLKGSGGYTVWNAAGSKSFGTQLNGGGGNLPGGGTYAGLVGTGPVGSSRDVDQYPGADFGAKLQACVNSLSGAYGGTCDARNYTGSVSMGSNVTISTSNVTVLMPCATIATANQIVVAAGTRNVSLRGCALRGGSAANGSAGGTAIAYSGVSAAVQVGDASYAVDTPGFHMDNAVINTTAASASTAQGIAIYRTQELDLESLYLLGNSNQNGVTLDGTGNYTGGTIQDVQIGGFQTGVNAIGHQTANAATTDWLNASTFVRLHINCPTSGGSPIAGTYGINLQQGDGNTFTGGDVEGCATALHLGSNAQNNTIVGLRNENSTQQVAADAGSQYNSWITAGTMFTGKLTDNGTHNSFWDSFHRGFNGVTGDLYRSQTDATITNHYFLGTGQGHVRGLQDEYFTDVPGTPGNYQAVWEWGPQDGASGQQVWALQDMLNNVSRLGVQENTTAGGNPQTYLNAAGGGSVCFNCSSNSGTGGVSFSSGGASPTTVATINNAGNAQLNGTLQVNGTTQSAGTITVRNNANAEVDYFLWPGQTTSQKGSFTYKDWNGASQWYMVKDASNNWALNSAIGGLDSIKAYQSTNSGDTYINASNSTGHIRLNYESGSGAETDIYAGSGSSLVAAFLGPTAVKLPGLAASSGRNCLQIDTSGYITPTGSACGSGSGGGSGGSGIVDSGTTGQIAYYAANGTEVSGMNSVPVTAGGTGAATAAAALSNLGAAAQSNLAAEISRAQVAESGLQTTANAALPANGCTTTAGGNVKCPGTVAAGTTLLENSGASYDQASIGSELLSAAGWSSAGWTGSWSGNWVNNSGNTSSLSYPVSISAGGHYRVAFTVTNLTQPGTFTAKLGGTTIIDHCYNSNGPACWSPIQSNDVVTEGIVTADTTPLIFTPDANASGLTISNISVKPITASPADQIFEDSIGNVSVEGRTTQAVASDGSGAVAGNMFLGVNAGRYLLFQHSIPDINQSFGYRNTAIGYSAGSNLMNGRENTMVGFNAGANVQGGQDNTFFGAAAGYSATAASWIDAFGYAACYSTTTAMNTSCHGTYAGYSNTTGNWNLFDGYDAGLNNTTGSFNTVVGSYAGVANVTSNANTYVGYSAGTSSTGDHNTYVGYNSGTLSTTATQNTFVGAGAGFSDTTGGGNSFVGYLAGQSTTTGTNNLFVGVAAGQANVSGSSTTALGNSAGYNNTASDNTFLGFVSGYSNTSGTQNAFMGRDSGLSNSTGSGNAFVGYGAAEGNTTGSGLVAVGESAGRYIADGATANSTSSNSVFLGAKSKANSNGDTNEIAIGYGATGAGSNSVMLGSSAVTTTVLQGVQASPIGSSIASAATIAPTAQTTHITGTAAIATVTPPRSCTISGYGCALTFIVDAAWTLATGGNIASACTPSIGSTVRMTYDPGTSIWYPVGCMPTIVTPGAPVVTFGQASQMGSNTTNYFGVNIYGANGYYNNVYELSPRSATVSNLFCSIDVAPGTGQTVTFTILTGTSGNGTASPVTCQIAGTSSTSCNDTAHTLSLGQGTGWGMSIATSGSSASIRPRCMVLYQ